MILSTPLSSRVSSNWDSVRLYVQGRLGPTLLSASKDENSKWRNDLAPTDEEIELGRHRAASGLESALSFVSQHGSEMAILRSRALLGAESLETLTQAVGRGQTETGGFLSLGLSSAGAIGLAQEYTLAGLTEEVAGTLEVLLVLSDLGALSAPFVEPAAVFLGRVQNEDGSWGAPETDPPARLFTTGMIAGLLGRTRVVRPVVLSEASGFLEQLWSPERIAAPAWPALTAFAVFFSGVDHEEADGALQWIGRELETGYRKRFYDAVTTVRTLLHCQAVAVPGASLDPFALLTDLLNEQGEDGGFAELTSDDERLRVEPTLDAMLGILRLCSVL